MRERYVVDTNVLIAASAADPQTQKDWDATSITGTNSAFGVQFGGTHSVLRLVWLQSLRFFAAKSTSPR